MKRLLVRAALCIALIAFSDAVGVVSGLKRLYPTNAIIAAGESLESRFPDSRRGPAAFARWQYGRYFGDLQWVEGEIHPDAYKTNISNINHVHSTADVDEMRQRLHRYIWNASDLPRDRLPAMIERGIKDERYNNLASLDRIDRYIVDTEFGINSIVYHSHPSKPNGTARLQTVPIMVLCRGMTGRLVAGADVRIHSRRHRFVRIRLDWHGS